MKIRNLVILLSILALGAALRWYDLAAESLWYDEAVSVKIAGHSLMDIISGEVRDAGNPPLYYALLHLWLHLWNSDSETAARSLSVGLGVLGLLALFCLARRWFDLATAYIAISLLALSPLHLYLSQEARSYSLAILLAILSFDFYERWKEQSRPLITLAYCCSSAALLYTHYYGFFLLLAQLVDFNFLKKSPGQARFSRNWVFLLIAILYLPWVSNFLDQLAISSTRSPESWYLHALAWPLYLMAGRTLIWKEAGVVPFGAVEGVLLLTLAALLWPGIKSIRPSPSVLFGWLLLPYLAALAISILVSPILNGLYLSLTLPALLLWLALSLRQSGLNSWMKKIPVGSLIVFFSISLYNLYAQPQKDDWRSACAYFQDHTQWDEAVIIHPEYKKVPFQYYVRQSIRFWSPQELLENPSVVPDSGSTSSKETSSGSGIWVFTGNQSESPEVLRIRDSLHRHFTHQEEKTFRGLMVGHYWN